MYCYGRPEARARHLRDRRPAGSTGRAPMRTRRRRMTEVRYASPVDTETYGEYRIRRAEGDDRPLYRFSSRITADGSSGRRAEPGRYHVYGGWACPWSQRVAIQL